MITIKRTLTLIFLLCTFSAVAGNAVTKPLSFDLYADVDSSRSFSQVTPSSVTQFNGSTVFVSETYGRGRELLIKRGNAEPELLADVNPGPADSFPLHLKAVGDRLYFTALNNNGLRKLWFIDTNGQMQAVDTRDSQGHSLHVRNYLVHEQGYYLLGFAEDDDALQNLSLWHFREDGELTVIDGDFAEELQRAEVSNLIQFNGHLFVFLYSDNELENCILRRYEMNGQSIGGVNFACDQMNYEHEYKIIGNTLFFSGKEYLLAFDGVNDPAPALSGNAPTGKLTAMNSDLYVSTTRASSWYSADPFDAPYVYRITETSEELEMITTPLDSVSEGVVLELATFHHGDNLYIVESSGYWLSEFWNFNATRLYRFDPQEELKAFITELDGYDHYLQYRLFLSGNDTQLCVGEEFLSIYCLNDSNALERQDVAFGLGSAPSQLTVVNDELYFTAHSGTQHGLWKSDKQQNIELVEEADFNRLISWRSDLYSLNHAFELEKLDGEGNRISINQTVESFPQNITDMRFGNETISMLIAEQNGIHTDIEIWQFDGDQLVTPILQTSIAGRVAMNVVADKVYLSVSHAHNHAAVTQQCAVYVVTEGELHLLAEQQLPDETYCISQISDFDDEALAYFEYSVDDVKHSSFARVIAEESEQNTLGISWLWQNLQMQIYPFVPQAIQDDSVFFCGESEVLGSRYFDMFKVSSDGVTEIVDDRCFTEAIESEFSGESVLYLMMAGTDKLHRLQGGILSLAEGINSELLGEVKDIAEFNGDLILSVQFADDDVSYGHELVRVSVINDEVVYAYEYQMDIHLTANAENYDIGQLLAALDSDEGDEIRWELSSAPKHGSLAGLPVELTSEGNMLEPESVSYKPHLGYVGRDTFEVTVSDGFSQSTMALSVTVSDVNTSNINSDVRSSSGGSIGILLLFLPVAIRRFVKGIPSVKSLH